MDNDPLLYVFCTLGIAALVLLVCFGVHDCGHTAGSQEVRKEAVTANAAHYELEQDNDPVFVWGPKPEVAK